MGIMTFLTLPSALLHFGKGYSGLYPIRNWKETDLYTKPFVLWTDLDDTLIPWEGDGFRVHKAKPLLQTKQVLGNVAQFLSVNGITGRGLSGVKKFANLLDKIPLTSLAVNNGAAWFINKKRENATNWIGRLRYEDQVPFWQIYVQKRSGWDLTKVRTAIWNAISIHNFKPESADPTTPQRFTKKIGAMPVTITFHGDETTFTLWSTNTSKQAIFGEPERQIAESVMQTIDNLLPGMELEWGHKITKLANGQKGVFTVSAKGFNKSELVEIVSRYQPKLVGVVAGADHPYNDHHVEPTLYRVDRLHNPFLQFIPGKRLPRECEKLNPVKNWRIISEHPDGRSTPLRARFSNDPYTFFVSHGNLGPAIEQIIDGHRQQEAAA